MPSLPLPLRVSLVLLFTLPVVAQQAKPKFSVDDNFVQKQFGSTCDLIAGPQPLIGDLDGDGIDDLVVVAHCKNPVIDQAEDNFTIVDPYNAFFGYGDTRVTSQFASEDPKTRGIVLLVVHGAGADAWHADKPKSKFLIINLPFKQVTLRKLAVKKKTVMAIYAEESGADNTTSATFWDGKKYRYSPLGSGLDSPAQ
jgi:hypothetical protein